MSLKVNLNRFVENSVRSMVENKRRRSHLNRGRQKLRRVARKPDRSLSPMHCDRPWIARLNCDCTYLSKKLGAGSSTMGNSARVSLQPCPAQGFEKGFLEFGCGTLFLSGERIPRIDAEHLRRFGPGFGVIA